MHTGIRLIATAIVLGFPAAAMAQAKDSGLPRAAIEDAFKKAECTVALEDATAKPDSYDLGDGQRLFIVSCWQAAYQAGSLVFVTDRAGQARLMTFKDWDGKKFAPVQSLSETDFDPDKKTISMFYKGRGIGDCGSMATWSWSGTDFKLQSYFFKKKCDGHSFAGQRRWQIFPRR